jgi:hypothetical protein
MAPGRFLQPRDAEGNGDAERFSIDTIEQPRDQSLIESARAL